MKIIFVLISFLSSLTYLGASCTNLNDDETNNPVIEEIISDLGISNVIPSHLGREYVRAFNRYTKVATPNGKAIHIVAQKDITDEQIIRCRSILEHYLKNFPESRHGADKSSVANKMAENNAILCLLNGEDDGNNETNVRGQYLFKNEIQVEGGDWYMNQNYEHRDAAFEEILHLVHDNGIGVDGDRGGEGALPSFQSEIRAAQKNAQAENIWGMGSPEWINELAEENSLSQEYLASVIDTYYGLWGAWEEGTNGMWGLYTSKVRSQMATKDPMGDKLMDKNFFHPYLTYNARIDAKFNGTFSLKFDPTKPYTNHSQYLKDITLLGRNNNSVVVNELNNDITGNEGENTVIFSGSRSQYTILTEDDVTIVTDNTPDRDGINTLKQVENLQFTDETVTKL